jgi:AcrR family transcriptional regulator
LPPSSQPTREGRDAPGASTDTRQAILVAAEASIRRWGIRRFSMNDVARGAGVSRMSVYRHFADRDALVLAVLERLADQTVAASTPAILRRRSLAAQIAEAAVFVCHLDAELDLGLENRPGEGEQAALQLAHVRRLLDRWIEFWVPRLAEARERGEVRADLDLRQAGEWIMRMILSLVTVPSVTVDLDDPDAVRRFVRDHIVSGLG